MAGDRDVKLTLRVSAQGLEVIDQAGKSLGKISETLKQPVNASGGFFASAERGFSRLQAGVVALNQGLELVQRIGRGVADVYQAVTREAIAQQNATRALEQTLRSTGQFSQDYVSELNEIASSYQRVTRFGDDAVLGVERQLIAFGASREEVGRLTGAVLDLSEGLGKDLGGATLVLGKAIAGEFGTLSRYGILVDENATRAEKLEQALRQISERFGGQAQTAAATYSGRLDQLSNATGELLEELGLVVVGSSSASDGLGRFAERSLEAAAGVAAWRAENQEVIDQGIDQFFDTVETAVSGLGQAFVFLVENAETAKTALSGFLTGAAAVSPALSGLLSLMSRASDAAAATPDWETGGNTPPYTTDTRLGPPQNPPRARPLAPDPAELERQKKTDEARLKFLEEQSKLEGESIARQREAATTLADAAVFRAETQVALAQARLAAEASGNLTAAERLTLAQQIDVAERAALNAQLSALAQQEQAILAVGPPTEDQLAKTEALAAQAERINSLWAATPSEVAKTAREIERTGKIDLGGSIKDVITGTALGTGDLGDSLSRLGQSLGSELFAGILDEKVGFDLSVSKNFLDDIPGWIETGASYAEDAWASTLDAMGLASESTSSRITDSFTRAFDEISGKANDTAQVVGGTLRNVPGVGNVATLFNGGANVTLSDAGGGRFGAVNEFGQRFTGANAGQLASIAGGGSGGLGGAGLGATVGAAAASFGIALGVQAGLEGIGEIRRLSKSDNPKDLDFARYGLTDPVQLGLQKILGVHDLTMLRGFSAMFSMGISEVAAQLFKAFGIFKPPTAEGVAGDRLEDMLGELGIPIARASGGRRPGGPSTRPFDPSKTGDGLDLGFPQVETPASFRSLEGSPLLDAFRQAVGSRFGGINGIGLGGTFDEMEGPLRGVLNNAAALGISAEDTRRQIAQFARGVGGETLGEGILGLRKDSQDRIFGLQNRLSYAPPEKREEFQQQIADEQAALERGIAGLIEAYDEDLPRAVDASRLALLAFGEDGELQMTALNRQIETAKDLAAGLDFGGAARAGFDTTSKVSFAEQLTRNARGSAADALLGGLAEGGIGDPFKEFTASIAEGTEALRDGDFERANDIIERAGREFDIASQSADEFFETAKREAPGLARLIDRIQIEGLADGFTAAAKSLREEADDLGLNLLKPKQREAEIRSRLGANQSEIDAILNSSGGADTADELTRLGELGSARRELLGDLGSVLDERYVDGSKREVAAMQEVQGGLTALASILDAAGISAKTQAESLAEQTVVVNTNTAATEANTTELGRLADAIQQLAASADNAGGALDAGAIAFIVRAVATNPQLKAAVRDAVT